MKDIGLTKPRGMNYACEPKAGMPMGGAKTMSSTPPATKKTSASRQAKSIQNK